ncbi:MAG TPA: carboxypeptidase-like regulatory domain-containing protein [Actinomycetota bacterium]|nr:carboxypeptidase-like regulatory domain-containing protein [Actinomycetota bacterium]
MTKDMRRASRVLRLAVPALLAAAALAAGPSAAAQTPGSIEGRVVNGTKDAPAADVEVSVQLFSADADLGTTTTTSDAKGRFAFAELPSDVAGYQLSATYEGAVYRSVAAAFTPGQTVEQTLTVWEPTTDATDVVLTDYIVWIDREGTGVGVQHDFAWTNGGDSAYVGDGGGGSGDGDGVVSVPLPQGATNLQYLGTFLENPGDVVGGTYVSDAPIVPGDSTATIRYNSPPLSSLTLTTPFPTTSVQLFVPQDVSVTATALRRAGTVQDVVDGQTVTYQVYAAQDVAAGTTIEVSMTQEAQEPRSSNPAMWILLGVAGLALIGGLVAVAIRRSRSRRSGRSSSRSAARPARAKAHAVPPKGNGQRERRPATRGGNGRRSEPPGEDADLIVEEIAALDLSFERGLLDERTYKRLRVAAKDRLLRAEGARTGGGSR